MASNHSDAKYYAPYYYDRSPIYRSWVKLFACDAVRLRVLKEFENTNARFHLNHPIRWIQCFGICVAVTTTSKISGLVLELDDGSGAIMPVIVQGEVAKALRFDEDTNTCDVEVGSLFRVRGELTSDWRGETRLQAHRVDVNASFDTVDETHEWQNRVDLRRKVLSKPWSLEVKDKSNVDTIHA